MKIHIIKLYLLILIIFSYFALIKHSVCNSSETISLQNEEEQIKSLLLRKDAVFASTAKGIYRASKEKKEWILLPTDNSIPPGGMFAGQSPNVEHIYYFTPRWMFKKTELDDKKVFGLYCSKNNSVKIGISSFLSRSGGTSRGIIVSKKSELIRL